MNGTVAAPVIDGRRRAALLAMLEQLVPACLPDWRAGGGQGDVAQAILSLAAGLEAEVTQRLDRVPEKQFRNFLDWIGIHRAPARTARLYVVLLTAPGAPATVLAPPRLRLQAQMSSGPIVFETDQDLLVVPGTLTDLVAIDGTGDKLYLPFPGLLTAASPDSLPRVRALAGPAGAGAKTVQVTPALGLAAGQSIGIGGEEYRITEVKNDLVSIDPPLDAAAHANDPVAPVTSLVPFPPGATGDTPARNWQRHELYIGATDLFDIDSDASLVVQGGNVLFGTGITWTYWGLAAGASNPDWLAFKPTPGAGTLTLAKQVPSTLPPTTLFGNSARWLRAVANAPAEPISLTDGLSVLVTTNPSSTSPVVVDAFANSVPLVTTTEFFPLGREPRLFDQFYVSAPEAMTKRGATVTLDFRAADESLGPLVSTAGAAFAVRNDGAFVQLSVTSDAINRIVVNAPTVGEQKRAVCFDPRWPPSIANYAWLVSQFFLFAAVVSDDQQVWLWRGFTFFGGGYQPLPPDNGWVLLGAPAGTTVGPVVVALETGGNVVVLAAVDGILHTRALGFRGTAPSGAWQAGPSLPADVSGVRPKVVQIAAARWPTATRPEQIVLVDENHVLWHLSDANDSNPTPIAGTTAHESVAPAVLWNGASDPVIVTADANSHPIAVTTQGTIVAGPLNRQLDIEDKFGNLGVLQDPQSDRRMALFRPSDSPRTLVVWPLDDTPLPDEPITDETDLRGAPVAGQYPLVGPTTRTVLLVPGSNLAVYSRDWISPAEVFTVARADLGTGVQLSLPLLTQGQNEGDSLLESLPDDPAQRSIYRIEDNVGIGSTHVFRPRSAFSANVGPHWRLLILSVRAPNGGIRSGHLAGSTLTLDAADTAAHTNNVILIVSRTPPDYESAKSFTLNTVSANTATLDRAPGLDGISDGGVTYQHVRVSTTVLGSLVPTLANVPQAKVPALLARGLTSNGTPAAQSVQGSASGVPFLVVSPGWTTSPVASSGLYTFHIPAAQTPGAWVADQQPVVPNPELSWEYWNGRSWLHIAQLLDGTRNLVQSGAVTFPLPIDITPTDVAGKNQPWVRARLIGGDYGKEIYKLTGTAGQSQTAERDTSQIHPPRMLDLQVGYTLTTAQAPDFLLTVDSLGLRDQSAANRLSGAEVTAFQPVANMLAGFGPDQAAAGSRALFLGIEAGAPPEGGVIRLLAFVREQPGQVRLIAETLRDGHFVELPLTDDTGGFGQDGLLSIALDAPLQLAGLYGEDRYWLRLRPRPDDPGLGNWQPVLLGLYLNAASAEAAETQDFEILGSSDGSPAQRVTLARPPVLAGSLDLRVREPLADEDIAALRIGDPDRVRTDITGRPGAWVRWTEVPDVADAAPGDRVHSLDPATGDIFFGDAQTGLVPPVGRDGIAALTYRRLGTAVANQVAAWASLNLVTTLPGVEQVVAPRPAAGGADPASDAATLAHAPAALRYRGRAITGPDLEAIALANTSELAQARFIQSGRAARLVVVATGQDPRPGKALRLAVRACLAGVMLPRLAARGGLAVDPPVLRPLALTAALTVESLDVGGTVDAEARSELEKLLDPATGGVGGGGWPIGTMPGEADVMAVLVGIGGLIGVTSLVFSDVDAAGVLHTPPRVFAAEELAVLAPDRLVLSLTPVTP